MLFPHPHPSFENVDPLPHNAKIRMIQIKEEQHPLLLSFPHPQFVATRSLIRNPPKYLHCILCWFLQLVTEMIGLPCQRVLLAKQHRFPDSKV